MSLRQTARIAWSGRYPRATRCQAMRCCRVDQPMSPTFITSTRRPSARKRASSRCGKASSGRISAPKVTLSPRIAIRR